MNPKPTVGKMPGRLNVFQRTMLLYDQIHPYNAVHVTKMPRPLEAARLTDIITAKLESAGLTGLVLDKRQKRFHYQGGPAQVAIEVTKPQRDIIAALCGEVETQINTPFGQTLEINPFRFFAIEEENSFHLGLAYRHFVAGGISVISLLKDIANAYMHKDMPSCRSPFVLYPGVGHRILPTVLKNAPRWLLALPALVSDFLQSCKPRYKDLSDRSNGFSYFQVGRPQFHTLVRSAKHWGVTLNDVFLAILLKSLFPLARERARLKGRRKISVGSIVDVRKDLRASDPEIFGVFLGSFVISHTLSEKITLEKLARNIHRQTDRIKKNKAYLRAIVEQGAGLTLARFLSRNGWEKLYRRNYPLWGGITNLNLDARWKAGGKDKPLSYFRAVSTDPVCPLVLSITTFNESLDIGLSYRNTVFRKIDVESITSRIKDHISNLSGAGE